MTPTTATPGFFIKCRECDLRFDDGLETKAVFEHFTSEHPNAEVGVELCVLCLRCPDQVLELTGAYNGRAIYDCTRCHRTRRIKK